MPSPKALASASSIPATAGAFQDPIGNPIVSGSIALDLSATALVTGGGEVAPRRVVVTLDINGKVSAGQSIWCNDQLTPTNTTYRITVYDSNGNAVANLGNQILSGAAPVDLSILTPVIIGT